MQPNHLKAVLSVNSSNSNPAIHIYENAGQSGLEVLPAEIVEYITEFLDVRNVCSLRVTSHSTSAKISQGQFRSQFRKKTISLTIPSLKSAIRVFRSGGLGCLLEDVTIRGTITLVAGDEDQAEVAVLLTEALIALRSGAGRGELQSLVLEVASPILEPSRYCDYFDKQRFEIGVATFQLVALALQRSEIPVKRLDLLGDVPLCSIPISRIRKLPDLANLSPSIKHVKTFAMSLSNSFVIANGHRDVVEEDPESVRQSFTAVTHLLSLMPYMENLELRWFTESNFSEPDRAIDFFFGACYPSFPKTTLRSCTLRGISVTEDELLCFLRETCARRIKLQEIHLHNGSFRSILDTLTRHEDRFEHFHLDDLFEEDNEHNQHVYFDVPGETKFPYLRCRAGPNEVIREGNSVTEELKLTVLYGRRVSSSRRSIWNKNRSCLFGSRRRSS